MIQLFIAIIQYVNANRNVNGVLVSFNIAIPLKLFLNNIIMVIKTKLNINNINGIANTYENKLNQNSIKISNISNFVKNKNNIKENIQ